MAKFYGEVGYGETVEQPAGSGKWVLVVTEKSYFGDIVRNSRRIQEGEYLNDDLSVQNSISIVADAYAYEHFHAMRYVKWAGATWKVDSVEVQAPRLLLRLGGLYNGQQV